MNSVNLPGWEMLEEQRMFEEEQQRLFEEETAFKHREEWLEQMSHLKKFNQDLDEWANQGE